MNDRQLPLFSGNKAIMAEGYRCLKTFEFEKAKQYFQEALPVETENDEEVRKALKTCKYWQPVVSNYKKPSTAYSIEDLYSDFRRYDFSNAAGLQQFKNGLLEYITELMVGTNIFYINDNETVFDLLWEVRHYKKAERVVFDRMEKHPDDHRIKYIMAQALWLTKRRGEANKYYAWALLNDPRRIPLDRIEFVELKTLINSAGPEMAPLYGWVRGILPLVSLQKKLNIYSKAHGKAIDSYRLLRSAEIAKKKDDIDACVEYRKKLKERAPDFYDEYYELLSKQRN